MNFGNCIKSIWRIFITAFLLAALTACGGEKLDGTSMANYEASKDRIMQGMSSAEMQEFKGNLKKAQSFVANEISAANRGEAVAAALTNPAAFTEKVIERLHGKTVSDVAEMAEKWDALVEEKEEEAAKQRKAKSIAEHRKLLDFAYADILELEQLKDALEFVRLTDVRIAVKTNRDSYGRVNANVSINAIIVNNSRFPIRSFVATLPKIPHALDVDLTRSEFSSSGSVGSILPSGQRRDLKIQYSYSLGNFEDGVVNVDSIPATEIGTYNKNGGSGHISKEKFSDRSENLKEMIDRETKILNLDLGDNYKSPGEKVYEDYLKSRDTAVMSAEVNNASLREAPSKVSNADVQKQMNPAATALAAIPESPSGDNEEYEQEYPDGLSADAWSNFVEEKYDWLLNQKVPTEEKKAFVKFYIADPGLFSQLSRHMQEAADNYSD